MLREWNSSQSNNLYIIINTTIHIPFIYKGSVWEHICAFFFHCASPCGVTIQMSIITLTMHLFSSFFHWQLQVHKSWDTILNGNKQNAMIYQPIFIQNRMKKKSTSNVSSKKMYQQSYFEFNGSRKVGWSLYLPLWNILSSFTSSIHLGTEGIRCCSLRECCLLSHGKVEQNTLHRKQH